MSYEPPLKITIPLPHEIPVGRGVNATSKYGGNLRIRCTNKEYDLIQREAAKLDVTLAMFCRWCSTYVAARLADHREAADTSMSAGDNDEYDRNDIRDRTR